MKAVGVDIGGTSLRIGLVGTEGDVSAFEKVPQREVLMTGDPIESLAAFILDYVDRNGMRERVAGLSVGLPAPLDKEKAVVLNAPNIVGFNGKNVKSALMEIFPFPVFLMKDVHALFYCDLRRFSIPSEGVVIACYIGTGIGNAIRIDGKLHEGMGGAAGELGHIPVWDSDEVCTCGNTGCMETLVGGKYLNRLQRETFSETPIHRLFAEHGAHPLLAAYVKHLSLPIATEINILDPETVILGGGVLSMEGFPMDELERNIRLYARKPLPERNLRFLFSDNAGKNGVIGAGLYAWEELREECGS